MALPLLRPQWPAVPGVGAAMSLREGGVSRGAWASLNLSYSVGDDPACVAENRRRFEAALPARVCWPWLVHGADVVRLDAASPPQAAHPADACWTTERGLACTVTAADCLPVLFALRDGSAVGAAHAGWRGVAAGVLEATVAALCAGTGAQPADLQAWVGPGIGPRRFEVGEDVLAAFGHAADAAAKLCDAFVPAPPAPRGPRWLADLPRLALQRLRAAGVGRLSDSGLCTVEDASRFFSHRRDRLGGRMAAAIWRT